MPDTVTLSGVNVAPIAVAGPDQFASAGDTVFLDGSGSSDANGDPLTYSWSLISLPLGSGAVLSDPGAVAPSFVADLDGTYVVQLIVNDGFLNSNPDSVTISVQTDNQAPDCGSANAAFDVLWPPNHKFSQIPIFGISDPDGDVVTVTIASVTQDEPTNGLGDGDTSPDAIISG